MTRLLLSVQNLRTHFVMPRGASIRAVDGISFDLREGETLCIVGESGSGKSVAARSILQIVDRPGKIVEGHILLHRYAAATRLEPSEIIDIANSGPHRPGDPRRAPQRHFDDLPGADELAFIGAPLRRSDRRGGAAAQPRDWARMPPGRGRWNCSARCSSRDPEHVARQYPFELSGGMRQRVMIAMALASNPRILIADEPTTALDVTTQAEILALISGLQKTLGLGVIFITHDMGVVANVADRVAVMNKGEIVEQNTLRGLFDAPQHPYTRMLLASTLRLEAPSPKKSAVPKTPADQAAEPLLRVRDLAKTFTSRKGVFSRTVQEVQRGGRCDASTSCRNQNVGVVGESGSGKSTVARCIVGLHKHRWQHPLSLGGRSGRRALGSQACRRRSGPSRHTHGVPGSLCRAQSTHVDRPDHRRTSADQPGDAGAGAP